MLNPLSLPRWRSTVVKNALTIVSSSIGSCAARLDLSAHSAKVSFEVVKAG
jgi:hypothetical protein